MKHIGLFEGIGGFSLAARWSGWETVAWCEWDKFGQKVLKHHFSEAEGFGDITKTDFTKYANTIDIVTGGFPCQPYSVAGKRKGKDDERHLWPEMLRAIREIKPRWVVGENVLGLVNWNGGLVFDEVQTDLEAQGYEVQAYILPACAKNAPHRRDRVWFVAYKNTNGNGRGSKFGEEKPNIGQFGNISARDNERVSTDYAEIRFTPHTCIGYGWGIRRYAACGGNQTKEKPQFGNYVCNGNVTDTDTKRLQRGVSPREYDKQGREFQQRGEISKYLYQNGGGLQFQNFPTQPPICGGNDGLPERLDGITIPKWRVETIKAYGNAIVPQVAFEIYKAIQAYENLST
jgi:DNA (cytosine-5)-methyltransferase 1